MERLHTILLFTQRRRATLAGFNDDEKTILKGL
jgi:hypothetical protein